MGEALTLEKASAADAARAIVDGIIAGDEEIFPDKDESGHGAGLLRGSERAGAAGRGRLNRILPYRLPLISGDRDRAAAQLKALRRWGLEGTGRSVTGPPTRVGRKWRQRSQGANPQHPRLGAASCPDRFGRSGQHGATIREINVLWPQ
jgi:hypothetical protein